MMKFIIAGVAAIMLAACATTGPGAYGPADAKGFGYADTRIESDRYRVVYRGSGGMRPELVEDFALRRAAELTLDEGYDWFRVVSRDIAHDQRGGVSVGAGVGGGSFGRRSGVGVGVGGNFGKIGAQDFFTLRIEILMGEGEGAADAYNAQDVLGYAGDAGLSGAVPSLSE